MKLAEVAGFEPTNYGVKVRCLTAWLYLIIGQLQVLSLPESTTHSVNNSLVKSLKSIPNFVLYLFIVKEIYSGSMAL